MSVRALPLTHTCASQTSKFSRVKHFVPERLRVLDEVFVAITRSGIFSHYRIIHVRGRDGSFAHQVGWLSEYLTRS